MGVFCEFWVTCDRVGLGLRLYYKWMGVCASEERTEQELSPSSTVETPYACSHAVMDQHLEALWETYDQDQTGSLGETQLKELIREAVLILSENWQKKRAAEEAKPVGSPQRSESVIATATTNIEVCTFSSLAAWHDKTRWSLAPNACGCNIVADSSGRYVFQQCTKTRT